MEEGVRKVSAARPRASERGVAVSRTAWRRRGVPFLPQIHLLEMGGLKMGGVWPQELELQPRDTRQKLSYVTIFATFSMYFSFQVTQLLILRTKILTEILIRTTNPMNRTRPYCPSLSPL